VANWPVQSLVAEPITHSLGGDLDGDEREQVEVRDLRLVLADSNPPVAASASMD